MNKIFKITFPMLLLISIGCQRTAPITPGAFPAAEPQTGNTIVNNLCENGTLDCIATSGPGLFTDNASARQSLYETCMMACCNVTPFSSINSNNCPGSNGATYATCNSNDRCGDILSSNEEVYPSDNMRIPDQAKAIEVEIDACYGNAVLNVVKFEGPIFNFVHQRTMLTQIMDTNPVAKGSRGDPVGQSIDCKLEGLYHKVKVKYTPVTSTSVSYGSQHQTVIPFTNGTAIERVYSAPNITSMGIPYELREELNLQQHNWVLNHAEVLGPIQAGVDTGIHMQYLINDAVPATLVNILTSYKTMPIKLKMVFFAQDAAAAQ